MGSLLDFRAYSPNLPFMSRITESWRKHYIDDPDMSDKAVIVSVEELIHTAFGSPKVGHHVRVQCTSEVDRNGHCFRCGQPDHKAGSCNATLHYYKNTVNFKLVQTILHILARQLRILEQDVEIKFEETAISNRQAQQADDSDKYADQLTYSRSSSEDGKQGADRERGREKGGEQKERAEKGEKGEKKERRAKSDRDGKNEREGQGPREGKGEREEKGGHEGKDEREGKGQREGKGERERKHDRMGKGERDGKGEQEGRGEQEGKSQREGKGERGKKGQLEGKGQQEGKTQRVGKGEREGKADRDEKGERGGKGEREGKGGQEEKGRGEIGEKTEIRGKGEKEDSGRGKSSSKDREGKERSKDMKYGEDKKRGDRESSGRSARDGQDYDERDEREDRLGGRERGGIHDDRKVHLDKRQESGTSITVTEATRKDGRGKDGSDKILVAERGPASSGRPARVGSIEVVTASQFAKLEQAVRQLEQVSGPPPEPALPDNEQLRKDLATGRASLSETMQAVQLQARVHAAEQGLARMAELLTQLATAGTLPLDLATRIEEMHAELMNYASAPEPTGADTAPFADTQYDDTDTGPGSAGTEHSGVETRHGHTGKGKRARGAGRSGAGTGRAAGALEQGSRSMKLVADLATMSRIISTRRSSVEGAGAAGAAGATGAAGAAGVAGAAGAAGAAEPAPQQAGVTHYEMNEILEYTKGVITKEIMTLTARANHSADVASNMSRSVAEKLDTALQINGRITTLFSQTDDYANQLSGFDSGLTTQMSSFQEQMTQMRNELKGGLILLESANNNAETAAIMDLGERYEGLVIELDNTVHLHQDLSSLQQQLSGELRSLVECVEMLREQKADRDEVWDGLRDKADMSRLAGLLYAKDFMQARYDIEQRLAKCYDKFNNQNKVWETALGDLSAVSDNKADIINLMALKEAATQELNSIQEKLRKLEIMLGEPMAALLMRKLAKDASCGACLVPALMAPTDASYGQPAALPTLRPAPQGAEKPCLGDVTLTPPDTRQHVCRRWVGGSHTLMGGHVAREKADEAHLRAVPTKKYEGYGTDGRLYMMEEDLQPCVECNKLSADEPGHVPAHSSSTGGDGDQAKGDHCSIEGAIKETIILG